ncbi:hypothetical protein F52700_1975 [Fusarium sp. NRRL 52700]|nr:hypothetical protein F52700_1975 [Fusarium sp. NRRL 52700]
MANPQRGYDPNDGEEPECLRQTQSRRDQLRSRRSLWSEIENVETYDLSVVTPVADSNNHQQVQRTPCRAYARDHMGIHGLSEQVVDSKYGSPSSRRRARSPASVSPRKCANRDSPSATSGRLAKDDTQTGSLPDPASGSELNMMLQPETRPISHEQLVAEVKGIYAGLVMVESKCIEVDNATSATGMLTPEEYRELLNASTQIIFEFPNNMRHVCTTMPWTILPALLVLWGVCWMFAIRPGDIEPEKFKAPVPTFSPATYDFFDNSGPAYYELGLQSVLIAEPSTTGLDQHPTIDSLLFDDGDANIDPIYLIQAAPQDPDFLSLDMLPRDSAGVTETSAKEDLTGPLPAAVTPDPILQTYRDANRHESFNPMVNVASVGQGVQNAGGQKSTSYFACPKCQQTFATSFTLNRHQTEAHKDAASSPEESFPCQNRGCKRSEAGSPFKRLYNLNRHLRVCKHNPNISTSSTESDGMEEPALSHPIPTPALPDGLQRAEPLSEGLSGERSARKRSRSETEDDWSEESLLREMKKKFKRMAQEVKEKEDAYLQAREGLESIQKTIQVMEDSLRKS